MSTQPPVPPPPPMGGSPFPTGTPIPGSPLPGSPVPSTDAPPNPLAKVFGLMLLIDAAVIIVSAFLEWGTTDFFGESFNARDVPIQFLWDTTPASFDSPSLWLLLLAAAALIATSTSPSVPKVVPVLGALLAVAVPLLYWRALQAVIDDPLYLITASATDGMGIGAWLCLGGAVSATVGAVARLAIKPPAPGSPSPGPAPGPLSPFGM